MEVFGKDWLLGNFRASDYGLILASFDYGGESEDEIGFKTSTIEEFIGSNPVPLYLGDKYSEKLRPQITLCKNPDLYTQDKMYFSQKDCREILRLLTGLKGYQWMRKVDYDEEDDIWFRAKITNVSYKRVAGHVVGFIFEMECDSTFGYSAENIITINAKADTPFYIFNNTDDLHNYVFPLVEITSTTSGTVTITNVSDNNWVSEIKSVTTKEKISIDSKNEIVTSSISHNLLLNDFNLHFPRLVEGRNKYISNIDATITFKFRVPRKVGFIE